MSIFKVSGIQYELDVEDRALGIQLPEEMVIKADHIDLIADKISDATGFLVKSIESISLVKKTERGVSKKKFTVRFHRDAWTDITVEAKNEEEAYELAEEKYNNGKYEDFENFENTHYEIFK